MNKHLAILRDDHMGDMILTTPLARAMASAGWRVTVVGKAIWAPVWNHNPHATYHSLESIAPDYPRRVAPLSRWLRKLAPTHLFIPYHCPPLYRASFLTFLPNRYCLMGRWLGRLTLHRCLRSGILHTQRHMGEVWQDFAEAVGVPRQSPRPELFLSEEERSQALRLLSGKLPGGQPLIVIHPFHGGSSCHIPLSGYVEVARRLVESGRCRVVVTGLAREREQWLRASGASEPEGLWLACGELDLRALMGLVSHARYVVCGSTGVLHIASALNIPSISAMCPHPLVSPKLWSNLADGVIDLSPDRERCARYGDTAIRDCGFANGPTAGLLAETILGKLGA